MKFLKKIRLFTVGTSALVLCSVLSGIGQSAFSVSKSIPHVGPAKSEINGPCTPASNKARRTVEFFLTASQLESFRVETGTNYLTPSQIQHVDNITVCEELNLLVANEPKLQHSKEGEIRIRFYYKAENFYFLFYLSASTRLGYTRFFVLDGQYNVLGDYGI